MLKLQLLVMIVLLREIGFEDKETKTMLEGTETYAMVFAKGK
jgi:hypothetical protein